MAETAVDRAANEFDQGDLVMWDYTDQAKEHFLNPRNVGEVEDADGIGDVGSVSCGDALRLTFKLDADGRIADAKFKTFGCASAIASSSALTEMIKRLTIEEAEKISNQDIVKFLGGLPQEKMHCSVMGKEALDAAIAYYRGEKVKEGDDDEHGRLICSCFGVTEGLIEKVVRENNLKTVDEVTYYCKAGGGCETCHENIEEILEKFKDEADRTAPAAVKKAPEKRKLTMIEKLSKIQETINTEIKPSLAKDGGDVELIDLDGDKVIVALRGACSSCPSAGFTLRYAVEQKLKEFVSDDLFVEEVKA